jgi:hypothetical protein
MARLQSRLAGARARNPHLDIQHALDVLHFVARESVRENATSALRTELIEAIQDIVDDLESSDLPIHQQRAGEIERFLDARPFNPG